MDNFDLKKFLKDQYLAEGSCGYTPDGKPRSKPAGPDLMKESPAQDDAVYDLRNIVDDIEQKSDDAREIVRTYFPNELSRLEGYGAFNLMYSNNRYDVTLGKFVDRLEEEGYEIKEDDEEDDMHDDPGDIRIDHDYYTEDLNEISRDAYDRMEGLANQRDLNELKDLIMILGGEWANEGFENEDIVDYFEDLVYKLVRS